jgi:hypothetical protein
MKGLILKMWPQDTIELIMVSLAGLTTFAPSAEVMQADAVASVSQVDASVGDDFACVPTRFPVPRFPFGEVRPRGAPDPDRQR